MKPCRHPETADPPRGPEIAGSVSGPELDDPPRGLADFRRRALWLAACIVAGGGVGLIGQTVTGEDAWYLALPGAVTLGWLYFGRPEQCSRCASAAPGPDIRSRS